MVAGSELRRGPHIGPPSVSPRISRFLSRPRTDPGKGGDFVPGLLWGRSPLLTVFSYRSSFVFSFEGCYVSGWHL